MNPVPRRVTAEDGVDLCVWDYGGEGPPLLLCHCTGTCGRIWEPLLEELRGFRVLALDTRGHGESGQPTERPAYEWWRLGGDVLSVVDALALPLPMVAAGHSCGASMLAYAALKRPDAFSNLVLIDGIIGPAEVFAGESPLAAGARRRRNTFPSRAAARENFAAKPPMNRWAPAALDAYVAHALHDTDDGTVTLNCPGAIEAWFYELGGASDVYERLGEIACRPLVVSGDKSNIRPLALAQQARIPGAVYHEFSGCGHFIPQEQPERCGALIRRWLRENTRA